MKKSFKLTESQLIELIKETAEEYENSLDPCFEKQMKFYQSPEGKELIRAIGILSNTEGKPDRSLRKRARQLMKLVPKC